jgi:uncharacterized protein YdeI (YjbR/CyaY-like superfamily)
MKDPALLETAQSEVAMGHLGRITSLKDLPSDIKITSYIKEAMELNDKGIKLLPKPTSPERKELIIPDYFLATLKKNKMAMEVFESLSYSHKKEYVEWVTEAKTAVTREKRLAQSIEMLAAGKGRNDKYKK